ncbi:ATP-grasp fold amidoligase family protein [Caballeronia concitans]|uniref:Uncharacterized protein n=1 Tax=Caballeronia concitans TaxID=1777133 RepID=A0A658QZZ5_9BURK|nr:ATP-grasp fold amidoligase family protein [Caballeronia concitans]KIG10791.1 hypothetical protein BurMR1_2437 [Burkholderia sp. MR1]SAL36151.1 hypothetical protein AWB72_03593 [Caballeronia concitans]
MTIPAETRSSVHGVHEARARTLASSLAVVAGKTRAAAASTLFRAARSALPDALLLRLLHRRKVGRFPNLANPSTFNELILDRCLNPQPQWTALTDKLLVRDHVKRTIGERHLIPLIAAPDVFTRDVFDSLPDAFVMKANHGCGFVKVVWRKADTSFEELSRIASRWLDTNFYRHTRERHYEPIERRVFFEKLLLDKDGKIPPDIKLNIFGNGPDGRIIYTGVITDRFGQPRHDFYDPQWNRMDIVLGDYPCSDVAAPPLRNWKEIVEIATRLADGLGYVRVDLYAPDDHIYFGELTFTPGGGLMRIAPDHYDHEWGRLIRQMG